jgi:hypothetical protein
MTTTYDEVRTLVQQLSERERRRLFRELVAELVGDDGSAELLTVGEASAAWDSFFQTLDNLADTPYVTGQTSTQFVTESRR